MSAEARIRRLEAELESLRRSTRVALEESWQEVERLESDNAYREEKILALQLQLASYMDKETEEDLRDSTSASSSQSTTSPASPESKKPMTAITSKSDDDSCSLEHRIEINFPGSNPMRSLLQGARQSSLRSIASIGSRQNSFKSIGSPMSSLRTGMRSCNASLSTFQYNFGEEPTDCGETNKADTTTNNETISNDSFPISALRSQLRSGLKKCSSFKVKSGFKEAQKINEPSEMEKALLRQLEYLQEEKNLDVQDLELKIEQRDAVIDSLEAKVAAQESTIKELQQKLADLRKRLNRNTNS